MALPFNTPNPYGSYFDFGEDPYGINTGLPPVPSANLGFGPGLISALGKPVGGFNPTTSEFQYSRGRDIAYQQHMATALREDARAQSISQLLLRQMSQRQRTFFLDRIGGEGNLTSMTSFMLNMPGVSEWMGGSQRSLAFGALTAASGGMRINGMPMWADNRANLMFAEQLRKQVTDRFVLPSGAMNLMSSQGLNRDQLGGVMALASAQGAFSGLDMGQLETSGDKARMLANPATMDKITKFMANAAKALGNLMDVYGKLSAAELATKAQQITGLDFSQLGNPSLINNRLNALRATAQSAGIDVQTMFDLSARAGNVAMAYGLPQRMGFQISQESIAMHRLGQQDIRAGGFYFAQPSIEQLQQSVARDLSGMARDPVGGRMMAIELMMQNAQISGGEAEGIRSQMAATPANAQGIAALNRLAKDRFGYNLPGYIQALGGPSGILSALDPNREDLWAGALRKNFRPRQEQQLKWNFMRIAPEASEATRNAAMTLFSTMDAQNLSDLMGAVESGGDLNAIIARDLGAQKNPAAIRAAALAVKSGLANPGTVMATWRQSMLQNPLTSNYRSAADAQRWAASRISQVTFGNEEMATMRGALQGTISDSFWNALKGLDTVSLIQLQAAKFPKSVYGFADPMQFNRAAFQNPDGTLNLEKWRPEAMRIINQMTHGKWKNITDPSSGRFLEMLGFARQSGGKFALTEEMMALMERRKSGQIDAALLNSANLSLDAVRLMEGAGEVGLGAVSTADGRMAFYQSNQQSALQQSYGAIALAERASSVLTDKLVNKWDRQLKPTAWQLQHGLASQPEFLWSKQAQLLKEQLGNLDLKKLASMTEDDRQKMLGGNYDLIAKTYARIGMQDPKIFNDLIKGNVGIDSRFSGLMFASFDTLSTELKEDDKKKRENIQEAKNMMMMAGHHAPVGKGEMLMKGFVKIIGNNGEGLKSGDALDFSNVKLLGGESAHGFMNQ